MTAGAYAKVVVLPVYGIGDMLMATPALRNLKERTGTHITCLHMFKTTQDVLAGNPAVDENHHFPFLDSGKAAGLRFLLGFRGEYDASINFYPSNRKDYNLAAYVIGARVRVGHRYVRKDISQLNFLKNRTFHEHDSLHNVEENLRLLTFLGIEEPEPYPLFLHLSPGEEQQADEWFGEKGLAGNECVGFHPGSSLFKAHAMKRWPMENFVELIRRLSLRSSGYRFLLFGGPEEDSLKEEIRSKTGLGDRVVAVKTAGIRQTATIMRRCKLFITNDSGLMHVAAALQVPAVAMFGPTNPLWLHPWRCEHRVLRHGSCPSCFRYSPAPQMCETGGDFSCIKNITVEEAVEAAVSLGA
jgi:heptosyltransferase-2